MQYSNYSVVSFPHYSSSTVVLTVIGVLVNSTPHSSETIIKLRYVITVTVYVTLCLFIKFYLKLNC